MRRRAESRNGGALGGRSRHLRTGAGGRSQLRGHAVYNAVATGGARATGRDRSSTGRPGSRGSTSHSAQFSVVKGTDHASQGELGRETFPGVLTFSQIMGCETNEVKVRVATDIGGNLEGGTRLLRYDNVRQSLQEELVSLAANVKANRARANLAEGRKVAVVIPRQKARLVSRAGSAGGR